MPMEWDTLRRLKSISDQSFLTINWPGVFQPSNQSADLMMWQKLEDNYSVFQPKAN